MTRKISSQIIASGTSIPIALEYLAAPASPLAHRCRLCTANDPDGAIEHLAEQLWESPRHGTLDDWPWAEAGAMWQRTFRELAATAVMSLR